MGDAEIIPIGTRGRPGRGSGRQRPSAATRRLAAETAAEPKQGSTPRRRTPKPTAEPAPEPSPEAAAEAAAEPGPPAPQPAVAEGVAAVAGEHMKNIVQRAQPQREVLAIRQRCGGCVPIEV